MCTFLRHLFYLSNVCSNCAFFSIIVSQDELEDMAASHDVGLVEVEEDDVELSEEARKMLEEARVREDMADMGFG